MSAPQLFDVATVSSRPICLNEWPCPRNGRAVLGPKVPSGEDCVNQEIVCQTCGKVGRLSTNMKALKEKGTR